MINDVSERISKEQVMQKKYYDKRHKTGKPFEVGTKVMKRNVVTHAEKEARWTDAS